jgi:hypothetical protein
MNLLDILFTSFHRLARYPLYIIISSKSMKWCKEDIEQVHEMMQRGFGTVHEMMQRGYRANPWNDVKRISRKSMKWCKEDIEQVISSLNHFMDLLDILCTSFLGLPWYHLYIISWTCSIFSLHHFMYLFDILFTSFQWCKEDFE